MLDGLKIMTMIAVCVCVLVLVAMSIDLVSGLYKAKLRNEVHTSFGYHRSVIKFITNEGAVITAFCIDVMLHFTSIWDIVGIRQLVNIPVVTILMGMFCCFVELVSIQEKADKKAEKHALDQLVAIMRTLKKEEVTRVLEALGKIRKEDKE